MTMSVLGQRYLRHENLHTEVTPGTLRQPRPAVTLSGNALAVSARLEGG
jgi:hypothetical protein